MANIRIGDKHYEMVVLADPATGKPYALPAHEKSRPIKLFGLMWQSDQASLAKYAALASIGGGGPDIDWTTECGRKVKLGCGIARSLLLESLTGG